VVIFAPKIGFKSTPVTDMSAEHVPRSAEISACAVEVVALWALPDRGNCTSSVAKIRTVMERLRMVSV
jgi:hypothetical protein